MKKYKKYRSSFLFARPSFLMGIGSVLNIAGNYFDFHYSVSNQEADTKAIQSDWGVVGGDIEVAAQKISKPLNLIISK